jgi:adenylate cyclase
MGRVEEGDLDVEVAVESGDEIGQLAHSFNQMIADLRERSLLQRHVGAHTLEMIRDSEELTIDLADQGQMQNLAVMFTDLRGSTDQIEHTEPHEFVRQLNRTFSTQTKIAAHFDGSIDKFVGDAMIAIFAGEAPLERALRCSIEIQRAFRADPLSSAFWRGLGIGVNYGPMLMGNMGTEERLDYSVIGAEVNLCARLCDAAGPGQILVRRDLIEHYGLVDTYRIESVGTQTFKGFDRQFEIAEVTYDHDA